jgi:quercetin dioxygenase-like cupin family protein
MTSEELLRLDDGETITSQERRAVVLLAERREIAITWTRYGAGERGPDLHVHREHTDAFYVLDGELTFLVGPGAERVRVAAGGFVAVPPNVVHTFVNESGAEASWLNTHTPEQGFAAYLRALRDGEDAAFDSFDPPADGGLPAAGAIVRGPGEGERLTSADGAVLLKGALPDLCVTEWTLDGASGGVDLRGDDARVNRYYALSGGAAGKARVLGIHAPDGGLSDVLRHPV